MRISFAILGMAVLASFAIGLMPGQVSGIVAVPDAEAATLYGGGLDALVSGNKCSGTAAGCQTTPGYSTLEAGTRTAVSKYCGSAACGNVPDDGGACGE